jgi:hypothetical protein
MDSSAVLKKMVKPLFLNTSLQGQLSNYIQDNYLAMLIMLPLISFHGIDLLFL